MNYFLNLFSNLIKVLSGFAFFMILTKVNSPENLGKIGQLLTFSSAIVMAGSLGIQNKLIQDFSKEPSTIDINYKIAIVVLSIPFLIMLLCVGKYLFYHVARNFGAENNLIFYSSIFLTFILSVYSQFKFASFNGLGLKRRLYIVNVFGSVLPLIITAYCLLLSKTPGYEFYLILLFPVFKCFLMIGGKSNVLKINNKINIKVIYENIISMRSFVLMTIFSIVLIYGYQYLMRILIAFHSEWDYVGQWQILQKHSEIISLFFSSLASMFIIPKIANGKMNQHHYISKKYSIGFLSCGILVFIILSIIGPYYVFFVFGEQYNFAGKYLYIHILGDIFKISAYAFTLRALCNAWVGSYFIFEFIQYLLLLVFSIICLKYFGVKYIAFSYVVSYLLFFFLVYLSSCKSGFFDLFIFRNYKL